jgi:hypothetical protein
MSKVSVHLSKSLHEQAAVVAMEEGVSMGEFIALAVAEKIATLRTVDYLRERAKRGNREKLLAVLQKAPDVEPDEHDRL